MACHVNKGGTAVNTAPLDFSQRGFLFFYKGDAMFIIHSIVTTLALNLYLFLDITDFGAKLLLAVLGGIYFIAFCIFPSFSGKYGGKLKILYCGNILLTVFLTTSVFSLILLIAMITASEVSAKTLIINSVIVILGELILFWDGMIRVYCVSTQLGIKWRVLGAVFGMIPIINVILLIKIISITGKEYRFECAAADKNTDSASLELCRTKYPILMVHGVFFRDTRLFNYWGRIPAKLEKNGAVIYYGNQQSAASVSDCAEELLKKIKEIISETGSEKVNIIAHSKGGLDARYAISRLGADKYTASLTTVNTPHRGCLFAEYLLEKVPEKIRLGIASKYNAALKKVGDTNPDFLAAVTDLTASRCSELNKSCPDSENVYYQSIGSKSKKASSGQFPLNLSYRFVKYFDGENDGLVSVNSMKWGSRFVFLQPQGKRGITHGDVIDLNRQNIKGFDVREFYAGIVNGLKQKGL